MDQIIIYFYLKKYTITSQISIANLITANMLVIRLVN